MKIYGLSEVEIKKIYFERTLQRDILKLNKKVSLKETL